MKLHWSFTHLIVLTIALSMLSATPALAFPCWTCCPNGPLCANPDNFNYRIVVHRSTGYTNTQVAGTPMTAAQWNTFATNLQNWQKEADANGVMAEINLFYKANQAILEAPTINMTKLVPALQSLGYKGTWTQLAWAMNALTPAQRKAMVQYVLTYGYDSVVSWSIAAAQAIAKGLALHRPDEFCAWTQGIGYWFSFAAMAAAVTGNEELVIPLGFIGATGALAGYVGGCNG